MDEAKMPTEASGGMREPKSAARRAWAILCLALLLGMCLAPAAPPAGADEPASSQAGDAAAGEDAADAEPGATAEPKTHDVLQMRLSKRVLKLKPGTSDSTTVTIVPYNATDQNVQWTFDDDSVASLQVSEDRTTATVTGVTPGHTTMHAKAGGQENTVLVWVEPEEPEQAFGLWDSSGPLGDTMTVGAWSYVTVSYGSRDVDYYEMTGTGFAGIGYGTAGGAAGGGYSVRFQAQDPGTTTLVFTRGDSIRTIDMTITPLHESRRVWLHPDSLEKDPQLIMDVDATRRITADSAPSAAEFEWTSSNESVATVIPAYNNMDCFVTAHKTGTVTLTLTSMDIVRTVTVTVVNPVETLELTPTEATVELGKTLLLTAKAGPESATIKGVSWSSDKDYVASVSGGRVTPKRKGTAIITAASVTNPGVTASATVTVVEASPEPTATPAEVSSVYVSPSRKRVAVGASSRLSADVRPSNAEDRSVTWASSDEKVATVSQDGTVTGVSEGSATVSATAANGVQGTCAVTVIAPSASPSASPAPSPSASASPSASPGASPSSSGTVMWRLYNVFTGEHFYTASDEERAGLEAAGWRDEGVGWIAPAGTTGTPVHRLYNANAGDHHYTASDEEYRSLTAAGWSDEGVGWYSAENATRVALYREYNPFASSGSHNYTLSLEEHEGLVRAGWRDEGQAWYAVRGAD